MVNETRGKKVAQIVEPYYPQEQDQPPAQPSFWPDDKFAEKLAGAQPKLDSGELSVEQVIDFLEKKAPLTVGQKARIKKSEPVMTMDVPDLEPPAYDDDPFGEGAE